MSEMGRVFRIWRGDWKKNGHEQWHFVPNHQDYGFTMYMDSPETLEVINATPVLITYGMPDWMMFPSGPSPPITIATTADLFLCRSDFTIGSSTYVVGDGQDERARARYESLVLGERLVTSERVMNEIFGEQEILILHRVALEIGHADRVLRPQPSFGVTQRIKIIQLDDDDEMVDVSQTGGTGNRNLEGTGGVIVPLQPQPLAKIPAADAPSLLWDVGLDLLDYPEDGGLVTQDSAFWNELIEDNYQSVEGLFLLTNNKESDLRLTQDQTLVGGGVISQVGNKDVVALHETAGESSTVPTAIISTLLESAIAPREIGDEGKGDVVVHGPSGTTKEKVDSTLPGLSLTLGLGCGSGEREMDDYGAQLKVGMMFRNRDSFKQHIAIAWWIQGQTTSAVIGELMKAKFAENGIILPESASPVGVGMPSILGPPATRHPPGRPKKLRYFSRGEKRVVSCVVILQLTQHIFKCKHVKCVRRRIKCGRCKGVEHNKATCKNPI
ncbi:hypothetical protein HID58_061694 [Brassica napus]|uniref:Uncharacterized protein n=1 Tax=Brassica napus TaxID=3708 RepID=A0ABQ7ZZH3_BRANA|nr:hypothetical protein HID58_061694 [Brassica napus]